MTEGNSRDENELKMQEEKLQKCLEERAYHFQMAQQKTNDALKIQGVIDYLKEKGSQ